MIVDLGRNVPILFAQCIELGEERAHYTVILVIMRTWMWYDTLCYATKMRYIYIGICIDRLTFQLQRSAKPVRAGVPA